MRPVLLTLLSVGCLFGCESEAPPHKVGPIELQETTVDKLDKLVASHKGKVVMIDIWFLGCGPCVKKFPTFIELHRKYEKDGLVCISLNVYAEELKEKDKVLEFLKKKEADIINVIFNDEAAAVDAWQEKNDAVATPSYVVYDRNGTRKSVPSPAKEKDIDAFVKKLLDDK